jgi:hypothetical protein
MVWLALVVPWLLSSPIDGTSAVTVAVVSLVLAALVQLAPGGHLMASRLVTAGPPAAGEAPPVLTGRVTDPVHHPLRPRAPGCA